MSWTETEKICYEYLNELTKKVSNVACKYDGKSDSTKPDVEIYKNDKFLFNVEIKEEKSQAAQFVIKEKNGRFEFSKLNKCKQECCEPIIDYINTYIEKYLIVGQSGIEINCDTQLLYNRLKDYYIKEKKSPFFIIKDKKDKFLIFKTNEIENYLDVRCVLRRKKSGSSDIPAKLENTVEDIIKTYLKQYDLDDLKYSFYRENKHYKILFNIDVLKIEKIVGSGFDLYFSRDKENCELNSYVLKILSKTNNPNVMFELSLKKNHAENEEKCFLEEIERG